MIIFFTIILDWYPKHVLNTEHYTSGRILTIQIPDCPLFGYFYLLLLDARKSIRRELKEPILSNLVKCKNPFCQIYNVKAGPFNNNKYCFYSLFSLKLTKNDLVLRLNIKWLFDNIRIKEEVFPCSFDAQVFHSFFICYRRQM